MPLAVLRAMPGHGIRMKRLLDCLQVLQWHTPVKSLYDPGLYDDTIHSQPTRLKPLLVAQMGDK